MADTAIFDVDGTLVDTSYQHALAWFRAFVVMTSPGRCGASTAVSGWVVT